MNKKLEARLRSRIRVIVESVIKEEGPMPPPANDFKAKPVVANKVFKLGTLNVHIGQGKGELANSVAIADKNGSILMKKEDAIKIANYLIRVLGKV